MSDDRGYFAQASSWADDARVQAARSRSVAWLIAGVAVAVAAFEAVALAMLAPLKTVQPITLLVDKQTGYVQAIDPLTPRRTGADEALTRASLAQYVTAREEFDRATVAADYRRVALWSAGRTRQNYIASMPATNPASPFQRYPSGATVESRVKSISTLSPGVALVRFDTSLADRTGRTDPAQPWVAVVRYRYVDGPMSFDDRLANPLGFQVTGYRKDAEAPPPVVQTATNVSFAAPAAASVVTTTTVVDGRAQTITPSTTQPVRPSPQATTIAPRAGTITRREVPINNLPLGSPLSPGNLPIDPRVSSTPR